EIQIQTQKLVSQDKQFGFMMINLGLVFLMRSIYCFLQNRKGGYSQAPKTTATRELT
ncbi:MAG: hypothetical protein ACI837_001407, partial [Crocinitomicaceae bacterium]